MIRSVEGTIRAQNETSLVVVVHNIGYLVYTNAGQHTFVVGDQVLLHTHLAVRENALDLYGFVDETELHYFELLLSVPKIGPKSALQVLNQASPDLLASAILLQDAEHLHKISGIGKKTASNIVSALEGKIDSTITPNVENLSNQANLSSAQTDAIDALVTLGYDQKEARNFVLKLDSSLDAKTLIQSVLKQIPIS